MAAGLDTTRFGAQLRAVVRECLPASRRALNNLAAEAAWEIDGLADKDTNRYIASIHEGFQKAGVTDAPRPPALRQSQYRPLQRYVLLRQVQLMGKRLGSTRKAIRDIERALRDSGYTSRGRPLDVQGHKWNSRLIELRAQEPVWMKLEAGAREQLRRFDSSPFAVVFGLGATAVFGFRGDGDAQSDATYLEPAIQLVQQKNGRFRYKGVSLMVTVRPQGPREGGVWGGDGLKMDVGGEPVIRVRSLEPHAGILESRKRIVGHVLRQLKQRGLVRLKRSVINDLVKAAMAAEGV